MRCWRAASDAGTCRIGWTVSDRRLEQSRGLQRRERLERGRSGTSTDDEMARQVGAAFFFFRRYYFCFRLFLFTELYRRRFTASRSYRLVVPQMAPSLVRSPYCSYTSSITFFSLFSERLPEISNPSSSPIYNKISYWDKYNEFGSPMILSIDPGVGTKKKLSDSVSKNI